MNTLICLLAFFSFLFPKDPPLPTYPRPKEDKKWTKIKQIVNSHSAKCIYSLYKLELAGSGSGTSDDDVRYVVQSYNLEESLNVEEARRVFVHVADELIARVNNEKDLKTYLQDHPFGYDNIDISVACFKKSGKLITPPSIAHVFRVRETLFYSVLNTETGILQNFHKEPFEEALRIVHTEQTRIPKTSDMTLSMN